jgi:hypothetical protein
MRMGAFVKAYLEISSAVIRIFPENSSYGDIFDFALFVVGDEDTAILKGLRLDDRRFTVHHKRAIIQCLKRYGFARACWDRYRGVDGSREKRKFTLELNSYGFSASHLALGAGSDLQSSAAA